MSYYNKDDEHKYRFVIWVAVCCAAFLLITIVVVICSVYVYGKKKPDNGNGLSNSAAVESMFSSIPAQGPASSAQSSTSTVASSSSSVASSSSSAPAPSSEPSQTPSSSRYYTGLIVPSSSAFSDFTVSLPVKNILQNPELPQGCEITSLAIAMNYKGYKVNKVNLANFYLPMVDYDTHISYAEDFFVGDPSEEYPYGLYCLERAIVKTIDNYNKDNPTVSYKTPTSLSGLYSELDKGNPVMVWVTLWDPDKDDFENPDMTKHENYTEYYNLHCMVLTGYSDTRVSLADPLAKDSDPLDGIRIIDRDRFEAVWRTMGNRAVSIE